MSASRRQAGDKELFDAVFRGAVEEIQVLLATGHSANARDADDRTPLHHAAIDGQLDICQILIEAGADLNAVDSNGSTPLHFAAQGHRVDIAGRLVASGARVDEGDKDGNTPLSNAVFHSRGRAEMIDVLVAAGADPGKKNKHGVSPRELAATIANFKIPLA
jgi:tankyrase